MAPLIPHGVQNAIKTEGDVKARPLSSKQNHAGNIASTFENLDLLLINNSRVLSNWIWIALVIFLLAVYTAAAFHYPGLSPIRIIPLVLGAVFTQGLLTRWFLTQNRHTHRMADLESDLKSGKNDAVADLSHLSAVTYLYVLGSGGHTTEMMALIKQSFKPSKNQHRRYITTNGDTHSLNQIEALENLIRIKCPQDKGTFDILIATRARAVHQSFLTSIFTSIRCANEIFAALTMIPPKRVDQPNAQDFKYPNVIVTNGPGTGFIVALVAFLLKFVFCAPLNRLKVIFIETWARDNKLGLTGKLFYWTKIYDLFIVQSYRLAKIVDKANIGNVNFRYAQLPRPAVDSRKHK